MARVGFLAQDSPLYAGFSVADHLKLGARLNPGWDAELARARVDRLDLDPGQKAGTLSGGERAQLALTLAVAKHPELLILDEPVASLDPLARREFLQNLMEAVAEHELSVVLSSHLVADLERVCDYLIVLIGSQVRVAGPVDELLAAHHLLTGPRRDLDTLPNSVQVISASHTDVQTTLLVRTAGQILDPRLDRFRGRPGGPSPRLYERGCRTPPPRPQRQPPPGGAEMIWLTWRQFRVQTLTAAAVLAAVAILLGATGPHLASLYAASGLAGCQGDSCANAASTFLNQLQNDPLYHVVYPLGLVLILATPALLGIFWGAPLIARELETGTYRLAWNQSVTRTRWLTVKLALAGLAAMAVTEALSLMHAWWADPISKATGLGGGASVLSGNQFSWLTFASHGITPLGYAAFAFTLGTAAGALIRRAVPAMAVTLAIFAVAQLPMPLWVRPNLLPPDQTITTVDAANVNFGSLTASVVPGQPAAWVVSSYAINAAGQHFTALPASCFPASASAKFNGDPGQCMDKLGIREVINYQPASRYWPLQLIETGIFLALALALAGFCFWLLGRRRA